MSVLILGGGTDACDAREIFSKLSTPCAGRSACDAVIVINDKPDHALRHLRHAMELRNSRPSLSIMIVTEVAEGWSPVEAIAQAGIHELASTRTAQLARGALAESWPAWSTRISDEAVTFEYQEAR
ncbi:MAG: hypothetical protein NVS9B10_04320 [Nevskia sp.]